MSLKSLFVVAALAAPLALATGCRPERHEVVPSSALLGTEGQGRLTYTTDGPGTLYIYDHTDDKLLYTAQAPGKRQVVVDPESNQITVDGVLVQDKSLRTGNNRKIFFRPTVR